MKKVQILVYENEKEVWTDLQINGIQIQTDKSHGLVGDLLEAHHIACLDHRLIEMQ